MDGGKPTGATGDQEKERRELTRRDFTRLGAVAGGLAWTAPKITTVRFAQKVVGSHVPNTTTTTETEPSTSTSTTTTTSPDDDHLDHARPDRQHRAHDHDAAPGHHDNQHRAARHGSREHDEHVQHVHDEHESPHHDDRRR